jgi:ABC exporter DevB family membrane fusion protein
MKSKKRISIALLICIVLIGLFIAARSRNQLFSSIVPSTDAKSEPQPTSSETDAVVLACTGRMEGESEAISVGAGIDGVIREMRVKEGEQVKAGEVIAVIERDELQAELEEARAAVARAEALRERLLTGSRTEERQRAEAQTAAVRAVIKQKKSRYERYEILHTEGVISADALDEARKDVEEAEANLQAARKNEEFVKAEPLPEELDRADAEIRAAKKRQQSVLEMMEKCQVRAPMAGTVLRTNMKIGEAYSTFMPVPIVTLADTSTFNVRAEVDERDVEKIFLGQKVFIRSDAFGTRKISGTVSRISSQMGRKKIRTGDPAEKSDRDVLEVLIAVEEKDKALVVGLRVTAQFLGAQKNAAME